MLSAGINDTVQSTYFSTPPYSAPAPPLYYDDPPWNASDPSGFGIALTAELEAGAAFFTYFGHGHFATFGLDTLFTTTDAMQVLAGLLGPRETLRPSARPNAPAE